MRKDELRRRVWYMQTILLWPKQSLYAAFGGLDTYCMWLPLMIPLHVLAKATGGQAIVLIVLIQCLL